MGFFIHFISFLFYPFKNVNLNYVLSFLSLSLLLIYFILRFIRRINGAQPFFFFLSFILFFLSLATPKTLLEIKNFSNFFFITHIIIILFGIGGIIAGMIYSFLYYYQEKNLKGKSFYFFSFPSLERCNILSYKSLRDGYILYTIGIFLGFFWSYKTKGVLTQFTLKETAACLSWFFFGFLYYFQNRYGWRGKRILILHIIGFLTTILAIAGIRIL